MSRMTKEEALSVITTLIEHHAPNPMLEEAKCVMLELVEDKENTLKHLRDEIAAYMNELSGIYENESEIFIPYVVNKLRQLLAVSL